MKKNLFYSLMALSIVVSSCSSTQKVSLKETSKTPFVWEGANLYFLMTDRFNNGDTASDINFGRNKATGKLRGFEGGDIKGIIQKIDDGYFEQLGINAIWLTPQIRSIKKCQHILGD